MNKDIDAAIVAIANHHEILVGEFPYLAVDKDFKKTILKALHFMRDAQRVDVDINDIRSSRSIPEDIIEAARKVGNYFANQGIREWKLCHIQNRIEHQSGHLRMPDGWQPIDTAPRDGTEILVGKKHPIEDADYSEVVQVFWARGKWRVYGEYFLAWEPTHWMPLPAPPEGGD